MSAVFFNLTALVAAVVGLAALGMRRRSLAAWSLASGMLLLSGEVWFAGVAGRLLVDSAGSAGGAGIVERAQNLLGLSMLAKAAGIGFWLSFGLCYSRGNWRDFLSRWRFAVLAAFVVPLAIALGFRSHLVEILVSPEGGEWLRLGTAAKWLNIVVLATTVVVLVHIEKTFRAAVGIMRWRVKFLVLGLGVLLGTRVYTLSQTLLYSTFNPTMASVDAMALLVACGVVVLGYFRSGFAELDIQPSRAVLQSSATIVVAGVYLFVIGVLSKLVGMLGGTSAFPAQAFLVLLGIAALAILLASDRFRIRLRRFVSRHFKRQKYDFRALWTKFSQRLSRLVDREAYSAEASKLISEVFDVLSVRLFLSKRDGSELTLAGSTTKTRRPEDGQDPSSVPAILAALNERDAPFDLDSIKEPWAEALREQAPSQFPHGGHRVCVPLRSDGKCLGALVLADRVEGAVYTQEDYDLLKCIGDELSAGLMKLRLTDDLVQARELEAFQTMSAFFVHDMKNAASSLNLTLQNLPKHMDDPEFREDALRAIGKTAAKIDGLTERLSALRKKLDIEPQETDLNDIVREVLAEIGSDVTPPIVPELRPLPTVNIDRRQIGSVVTNLLHNAREAMEGAEGGEVVVETERTGDRVVLSVGDSGCGMSEEFVRDSLFRPFTSTKDRGLGIGMFQSRMIVEAHQGDVSVESEPGKGTTFKVSLPVG